ncbi:flavohemoglobin expression-modulating QEGLA motif protein [Streptomyces sp. APSN-46.1]|uniref:tyrosine/phenylalanine carboxypeptidase domain-containing protein n=1 Tax=Streptomyces sp. APSN-46.1 TaxID=2929049 RepID=UPI001FB3EDE8|nr:tyrosine/phenylalanine carboxypeptidase domain-containing protein [Streptomyces sp. APSN-46.1]MCJ1680014.1 flavohemoglobin expression-modulating QEGLA motif protein [Streptomyces sp. APSN-46.1]
MNPEIDRMRRADSAVARYKAATAGLSLLGLVLPDDLEGHRERFLRAAERGRWDNPRFTYREIDDGTSQPLRRICEETASHDDPWHRLIADEAARYLDRYRACASHDAARITEATSRENGTPDEGLLADALGLLRKGPAEEGQGQGQAAEQGQAPELSADDAAAAIADVLAQERLADWTVRIRLGAAARMSVSTADRSVRIRAGIQLSEDELVRLIVHEIGTHVFRWVNALRGAQILGLQLSGHTATEEGFAVWNEQRAADGNGLDRRFALRVVAVDAALQGSFTDVVRALTPYTSVGTAFDVAVRVKRGLVDTSVPGGFVKDHVYLAGFRMLEKHLNLRPGDHDLLMSSKWPLHRLDLLRDAEIPAQLGEDLRRPDEAFVERARVLVRKRRRGPTRRG